MELSIEDNDDQKVIMHFIFFDCTTSVESSELTYRHLLSKCNVGSSVVDLIDIVQST